MKGIYHLLDDWRELEEQVKDGYVYTLYEFGYEMSVRDQIESLIIQNKVEGGLLGEITRVDVVIKENVVIHDNAEEKWWRFCVPKKATKELKQDVKVRFGDTIATQISITD